jgi:hypothetical protein
MGNINTYPTATTQQDVILDYHTSSSWVGGAIPNANSMIWILTRHNLLLGTSKTATVASLAVLTGGNLFMLENYF